MRSPLLMLGIAASVMAVPSPTLAGPAQTCIAIVLPSVRGVEGSATEVGTALRDLFASYLNGPSIAANTRAKDEMRLEYRVSPLDAAASAVPITDKAKARADREDPLTPMVERAAETIVAAVVRK